MYIIYVLPSAKLNFKKNKHLINELTEKTNELVKDKLVQMDRCGYLHFTGAYTRGGTLGSGSLGLL